MKSRLSLQLSKDIEERLRAAGIDLTQMAKEALLVDLYRQHKITHHQLGEALGLDRFDTDVLLKAPRRGAGTVARGIQRGGCLVA